ncbi:MULTISPECIES: DUF5024 domain-containing protein [Muribaculum]|jgi:uncharacterized protein YpmS|uniref:DUF5024 domain-containing protein n=1 Tax=Muribaculum gordoncarteri TaxID=2530390 RepID=A0A4P7VRB5_9BACT|nr:MULTISPECIES: DUF5024 domain-containing protein [Muribaculum]MCX4277580.1 DUF5024 domain-containing protein [Muribaculum sp.]QCD36871.1 DUF5024 domain-containing protein [Muribaculum gordoncarteri]
MNSSSIIKSLLLAVVFAVACSVEVSAQKNIQSAINAIAKDKSVIVNSVTTRNPKNHKIEKTVRTYTINSKALAQRLKDAFMDDEEQADKAIISSDSNQVSFTYYFNKRETMYSATITHGEQITVTYIFRPDGKDNGAVNVMIRRDKLPQMNLPLTAML